MTQSQVATHLADKVGINKKQAKTTIEELTALVVRELKREGSLRLAGLGIVHAYASDLVRAAETSARSPPVSVRCARMPPSPRTSSDNSGCSPPTI